MASYLASELQTRAARKADLEGSGFIGTDESLDILNEAVWAVKDLLISVGENHYVTTSTISLVSGTTSYALPADFYKLVAADFLVGDRYIQLKTFNELDKNKLIGTAIPNGTLRLRYVPLSAKITSTATAVDCFGYDKLVVLYMALDYLTKEESDTAAIERQIAKEESRILTMAQNRDAAQPFQTVDVYSQNYWFPEYSSLRYKLYGNFIEMMSFGWAGV